jgi:ferredoxin
MVDVVGERVVAASCLRKRAAGIMVNTATPRATAARDMVLELLVTDQPDRATQAHDPSSKFWAWADRMDIAVSRYPARAKRQPDRSHPAMAVNLDACIHCNLCVRACREVQVNDVIGMAGRGIHESIVFDFDHAGAAVAVRPVTRLGRVAEMRDGDALALRHLPDRLAGERFYFTPIEREGNEVAADRLVRGFAARELHVRPPLALGSATRGALLVMRIAEGLFGSLSVRRGHCVILLPSCQVLSRASRSEGRRLSDRDRRAKPGDDALVFPSPNFPAAYLNPRGKISARL